MVGYPLDTVKVRIQTQNIGSGVQYTGTFQCLSSIIKNEGVIVLFRLTERHKTNANYEDLMSDKVEKKERQRFVS